jgi:Rod binding domain-containing protein
MDSAASLMLTEPVPMPTLLKEAGSVDAALQAPRAAWAAKEVQATKDFESVLITKLLDAMKSTIGDWGMERDGASEQMQGIFWLYLGRGIADAGGFGMWKDIYQSLQNPGQADNVARASSPSKLLSHWLEAHATTAKPVPSRVEGMAVPRAVEPGGRATGG